MTALIKDQPEQEDQYLDIIDARYQQFVLPFWRDRVTNGYFKGTGNVQIAYAYVVHPLAKGSIAISSGRIETLLKYKELVFNLYNAGYSVFIHDHRGQGLSGRMTYNAHKGYVESFDDYVTDFKLFYDNVIAANSQHKPVLLAHSMGSAIASLYLLAHPDDFSHCVMSAPMFGIRPALPNVFVYLLLALHRTMAKFSGSSFGYFYGQKDYLPAPFERNPLTQSKVRYEIFRHEYTLNQQCQLGGVTEKWLREAYRAMSKIRRNASRIETPILMLQAGDDQVVDNAQQDKIATLLPNCELVQFKQARHELLMEIDEIRDDCLRQTLDFFSSQ